MKRTESVFAPSLICMDLMNVKEQIEIMDKYVGEYHIDIMDNTFVHNMGLPPLFARQLRKLTNKSLSCHLMAAQPLIWIPQLLEAGADSISIHAETMNPGAFSVISAVKEAGKKFGVVINPATNVDTIKPYKALIDRLTVMTIEPGFPGGHFIPEMIDKVRQAAEFRERNGLDFLIEIDGSCSNKNYFQLREAGADVFVVGAAALFNRSENLDKACRMMLHDFTR